MDLRWQATTCPPIESIFIYYGGTFIVNIERVVVE
jgi:hypothetical protein